MGGVRLGGRRNQKLIPEVPQSGSMVLVAMTRYDTLMEGFYCKYVSVGHGSIWTIMPFPLNT